MLIQEAFAAYVQTLFGTDRRAMRALPDTWRAVLQGRRSAETVRTPLGTQILLTLTEQRLNTISIIHEQD